MATSITAGNSANPVGLFTGGNDGAMQCIVGQSGAQRTAWSASQYGDTRPSYNNTQTITTTSNFAFDPLNGQVQVVTVTGNITITMTAPNNITEGTPYTLIFKAGDAGGRVFAWNAAYKWPNGSANMLSGSSNTGGQDILSFIGGAANTLIFMGSLQDVR